MILIFHFQTLKRNFEQTWIPENKNFREMSEKSVKNTKNR
ncbi:Protein CBG25466 [Caenorhabditis briggsae]|uniref:Protein CBG25466 n=1 Tax=Caenorhabditis briggsae TaxID=6238 RepID=B6IM00_CAEBR|nr:Protein CBG25466 [Caenorhabditis briggsae]CAS00930.1 Protein CBG25466 [Caenorhabditis briggsae]